MMKVWMTEHAGQRLQGSASTERLADDDGGHFLQWFVSTWAGEWFHFLTWLIPQFAELE